MRSRIRTGFHLLVSWLSCRDQPSLWGMKEQAEAELGAGTLGVTQEWNGQDGHQFNVVLVTAWLCPLGAPDPLLALTFQVSPWFCVVSSKLSSLTLALG